MIKQILLNCTIYISLILIYLAISINLTYKFYLAFNLLSYVILGFCIISQFIKLVRNKDKTKKLRIISIFSIVFSAATILYCKNFIDNKNLLILKTSNQNIPVRQLLKNSIEGSKVSVKYDSELKTNKNGDNIIYFTDEIEPALKLVQVYLYKAKQDNLKLFGDLHTGELKVKFDYDEEVFKKRNQNFNDYAGLYSRKEKTIYVFIKDCYSNALALNIKSSYLRHTLLHEYTHHVFFEFLYSNQIPQEKIPTWFVEGISEYIGYEGDSGYGPEKMIDFDELKTGEKWSNYSNNGYNVYEQSHYAVRQLVLMKGEKIITDILLKAKDADFNTAFKDVTGISLKDYEKALNEDFKNHWKKYNKMIPPYTQVFYRDVQIEGLEKYVKLKPNNIDALLDLAHLYEGEGFLDKAKETLVMAVERKSDSSLAWNSLAFIYEKMNNFNGAVEAFEKAISVCENPGPEYINLAQALLLQDVNKAAATAQKAKGFDKSSYIKKQIQAIQNYQSSIKAGKPYEGCLQLIKSDTVSSDNVEKALIEKLLNEYPNIKNSARSELEKIRGSFK